jgi:hypothetical protein
MVVERYGDRKKASRACEAFLHLALNRLLLKARYVGRDWTFPGLSIWKAVASR